MKQHGLLAIWILAITASAVLLFPGCRPADQVSDGGDTPEVVYEEPCAVTAGVHGWAAKKFIDGCSTNPTPVPIIPEVWCGLAGEAPERVLPGFDSVFWVPTESCRQYECHLLWEVDGFPAELAVQWVAELDPFTSGEDVQTIFPPDGCDVGAGLPN